MRSARMFSAIVAATALFAVVSPDAQSATCSVGDTRVYTADPTVSATSCAAGAGANDSAAAVNLLNLGGINTWELLDKVPEQNLGYLTVTLDPIPSGGPVSGTWEIAPPVGYLGQYVLVLKTGNNLIPAWAAFLISSLTGNWEYTGTNALSHATLYWLDSTGGGGNNPPPVPLPGALFLMGSLLLGYLGFGKLRRRRLEKGLSLLRP